MLPELMDVVCLLDALVREVSICPGNSFVTLEFGPMFLETIS